MQYKNRIAKLLDAVALGGEEDIESQIGAELEQSARLATIDLLIEQGQRQIEKELSETRQYVALKMASICAMDDAIETLLERRRQIETGQKKSARSPRAR